MARIKLSNQPENSWKFETRPGGWVIAERKLESGQVERFRLQGVESAGKITLSVGGMLWHGELAVQARGGATGSSQVDVEAALTAQFPGKVRKILVIPQQKVTEGEKLILVEAMKMEFAVLAPCKGVIKKILIQDGQQISPGDRFLEFESGT